MCDVRALPVTQRHCLNLGKAWTAVTKQSPEAPTTRHAKNTPTAFLVRGIAWRKLARLGPPVPLPPAVCAQADAAQLASSRWLVAVPCCCCPSACVEELRCRGACTAFAGQSNSWRPSVTGKNIDWPPKTLPVDHWRSPPVEPAFFTSSRKVRAARPTVATLLNRIVGPMAATALINACANHRCQQTGSHEQRISPRAAQSLDHGCQQVKSSKVTCLSSRQRHEL